MSAAHTYKITLIFCEHKNHSKENNKTIICDILNHSQENFVIKIKQISWSCPDPIFFKNKYPNPILIQKNRKYPAGYPILILFMLTSGGRGVLYQRETKSRVWSPRRRTRHIFLRRRSLRTLLAGGGRGGDWFFLIFFAKFQPIIVLLF